MNHRTISHADAKLSAEFVAPTTSYQDIRAQQIAKAEATRPTAFKVRAQLLEQGRSETVLAASPHLSVRLKVYASGGENALHAHATEDHTFVILQGEAEFFDDEGPLALLGKNEGIMIPHGSYYRFNATSEEPLVMLRVGSPNEAAQGREGRVNVHGSFADADSKDNKTVERIYRDGAFFGD